MQWIRRTIARSAVSLTGATAAVAAVLMLCAPSAAQDTGLRPMTIGDIMSIRGVGGVDLSPDGREVVYTVSGWEPAVEPGESLPESPERRVNLWLVPVSGGAARPLTFGDRGGHSPSWSPDGRRIAFVSSRPGADGEGSQVWVLPRDGGEAWPLTSSPTGVQAFSWSPDGDRIAFVALDTLSTEETARRRRKDDVQVYETGHRLAHVWVVDVPDAAPAAGPGEAPEAREVGHGEFTVRGAPSWSPEGGRLAFAAAPTPLIRDLRGGIYIADVAAGTVERVAPAVRPYATLLTHPAWSPDGRMLAFPTMDESERVGPDGFMEIEMGHRHLVLYDVEARQARAVRHPDFDYDITGVRWTPDGARLHFVTGDRAYESVFEYDLAADRFRRVAGELLVGGLSFSRDGRTVAYALETSDAPAEVHVSDATFREPRRLTTTNPQLADVAMGETDVVTWTSPDGTDVEGVLVKPVGWEPGRRYPLLVEAHGGPTGVTLAGFKGSSSSPGQLWAGRGWAVLYPNPRGSTNYGEAFRRANIGDWGGGDYEDVMAGVDALIERGLADPDRLAFQGWSYGGYLTARVITRTDRFRAARMGAGMSDIASMYLTTDIPGYIGSFFDGPATPATLPGYAERSPVMDAARVTTPLLILHGANDQRVPTGQALAFYRALRDAGKTVELVFYPRAGHGLGEYRHQVDRMERDWDWIAGHTVGEDAAAAASEGGRP